MAKALAGRIAITLAVDSLVRDLLPLAEHWTCFDPNFTGDKSGQTVYFNAIIEALKKHLPLLDRLEKVGPVRKVKAAYTNASKVVSSSKYVSNTRYAMTWKAD